MEVWVRQPGTTSLIMGWFRERAQPYPDALFLSNGDVQVMTFGELSTIIALDQDHERTLNDPRSIALHPLLRPAVREALTDREYMTLNERDPEQPYGPVATKSQWTTLLLPTSTASLAYTIPCVECNHPRAVSQRETARVTQLSKKNPFTCADIGLRCHETQTEDGFFVTTPPASVSDITPRHSPPSAQAEPETASPAPTATPNTIMWRKLIKHCGSIPYYDGSLNLTKLMSWKTGLLEAFTLLSIPHGREQVLAAAQFLKGTAKE